MFNKRGQSTAEYAIVIGVVVGAIMAVGVFLRGGIEAKARHMTNLYLDQGGGQPSRFETSVLDSNYETTSTAYSKTEELEDTTQAQITAGGGSEANATTKGVTRRKGTTTYFEK